MLIINQEKKIEISWQFKKKLFFSTFKHFFLEFQNSYIYKFLNRSKMLKINIEVFHFAVKIQMVCNIPLKNYNIFKKFYFIICKIIEKIILLLFFSWVEKENFTIFLFNILYKKILKQILFYKLKSNDFLLLEKKTNAFYKFPVESNCSYKIINLPTSFEFYYTQLYYENQIIKGFYLEFLTKNLFQLLKNMFKISKNKYYYLSKKNIYVDYNFIKYWKKFNLIFKNGRYIYIYKIQTKILENKIYFVNVQKSDTNMYIYMPYKKINIEFVEKIPLENIYFVRRERFQFHI